MSRIGSRTGVRRNRRAPYVTIESQSVRDTSISYRALGVLAYLLDQSDEWQVRSDQLSKGEGREGRLAVRTALRELAAAGYYRLERRRFLDGQIAMGTAVSEYPVQQWISDHCTFEGKPIPVIEQEDGTFLVRYPDGTLGPDGFAPAPGVSGAANPPAAKPKPEAEPREPSEESPAPPKRRAGKKATAPAKAPAPKKTAAEKQAADEEKAAREEALTEAAGKVAAWWYEDAQKHLGPYVGKKGWFLAIRATVQRALEAGYTQQQCALALRHAQRHWPTAQQWQHALGVVTNHIAPQQPRGRIPYSDAATWGDQTGLEATTTTTPDDDTDDDATFGIVT